MIMRGCELSSQSALGGGSEQPCSSLRQLAKRHRRTIGTEASGVAVKRAADWSRGLIDLNGHPAYRTFCR
jgi:hypothetical protein